MTTDEIEARIKEIDDELVFASPFCQADVDVVVHRPTSVRVEWQNVSLEGYPRALRNERKALQFILDAWDDLPGHGEDAIDL